MPKAIRIDAKGRKSLIQLKRLQNGFETGIRRAGYLTGRDMVDFAKEKMKEKPKTGVTRLIRRGSIRRRHTASNANVSPPEFPANLSGNLRRSLSFKVRGSEQLEFGAGAQKSNTGDAFRYARILELGGQAGRGRKTTIKPRHYLRQTINANTRNLTVNIQNEVKKQIK